MKSPIRDYNLVIYDLLNKPVNVLTHPTLLTGLHCILARRRGYLSLSVSGR